MAINNLNPRRTIWYSTHEPSNKYDLWLCPSTVTHDADGNPINPKCVYDLKIFECGKWKVINFCHCNGGDDPSHYVPVEGIDIVPDPLNMEVGESKNLSCIFTPSEATNKKVVWEVLGGNLAKPVITIDNNGIVTARTAGSATVRVTSQDNTGIQDTASVKVTSSSGGTTYTVSVAANPTNGGTITGGGTYTENTSCTITAIANPEYIFRYWQIDSNLDKVYSSSYTFTVTKDTTCTAIFTQNATAPTVDTTDVDEIKHNSARCYGEVETSGNSIILETGFCYGQNHNPSISDNYVLTRSIGTVPFNQTIGGLDANTTYYVRAYAKNSANLIGYGRELSFTTLSNTIPTVTTKGVYNTTDTSAKSGGNVKNDGGSAVTDRGICWSTSSNPTTADNYLSGGTGTGGFTITMNNLTPSTTYYVRAYAINSNGTAYGNEILFETEAQAGPIDPVIMYIGQKKDMRISDFKELSIDELMADAEPLVDPRPESLRYSYSEWNGEDYYITYFLVKNPYGIDNSTFTSNTFTSGIHWNLSGIDKTIEGVHYILYANRHLYNNLDYFTITIE